MAATEAAALFDESWGPGSLGGTADLSMAGASAQDLLASAAGTFRAAWQQGALHGTPRSEFPAALLRFARWNAGGSFGADGLHIAHSSIADTPATLDGTVGWDRSLHLLFSMPAGRSEAPAAAPVAIHGTLTAPAADPAHPAIP